MALTLVRLRWALTLNQWRRSAFTLVLAVLGALYVLGLAVFVVVMLVTFLPDAWVVDRGTVTVLVASALALGWLLIPPFITGVDATLDPHSFVLFPVRARTLIAGLTLSAFTTPAGLATLIVMLGTGLSWWDLPAALAAGLVGGALTAVTAVASGYGLAGLMAAYAGRRRVREVLSIALLIPVMLSGVIVAQTLDSLGDLFDVAPRVAAVAAWTPFGAGPAAAWAVAEGQGLRAAAHLLVAAAWCLAALALWHLAVRRTVEPVAVGGGSAREAGRADGAPLRWLGRPATGPRTAIAARAQRYWLRDPRYAAGLVMIPVLAAVLWFASTAGGDAGPGLGMLTMLGPVSAWALAYSISADIAYDHTAFHLHVVSGVRGADDRWGRVMGLAGWGVPALVVLTVATTAAADRWDLLPALLGLTLGLFGVTAAMSAFVSARFVYPVPKPGESPFKTPQGATMRIMLVQGAAMLVVVPLAVPVVVPFVVALVTQSAVWGWATLAVGLAWGAVALWLGVRMGAAWYDRAQAETYQAVAAF